MKLWNKMNFLERVISNYFLAWSQIFNYKDKTSRIPFWHFFILNGIIRAYFSSLYNNGIANDPYDFYSISEGYDWIYIYTIPSFLVFLALLIRRLRDIGKQNLFLWAFCSLIPIYNLYIFAQPSSEEPKPTTSI